ncbi:unnamed protein product, partial [Discosporangium mesarthrocarpum]
VLNEPPDLNNDEVSDEGDPCLFRYMDEEEVPLLVVTHVDDMITAGSAGDCDALCEALLTEFPTNNLGPLSWYPGCAFERDWEKGTLFVITAVARNKVDWCRPI